MILVDTSIWVEHARQENERLADLLAREKVVGHPFVIGELALGGFGPNQLRLLSELPGATVATTDEILRLIVQRGLLGARSGMSTPTSSRLSS